MTDKVLFCDGGESHASFLAFRDQAKQLAQGWAG